MGFLDKLMFWKKEEKPPEFPSVPELGRPPEITPPPAEMPSGLGIPSEPFKEPGFAAQREPRVPGFEEPSQPSLSPAFAPRPLEPASVSADKLETISATSQKLLRISSAVYPMRLPRMCCLS